MYGIRSLKEYMQQIYFYMSYHLSAVGFQREYKQIIETAFPERNRSIGITLEKMNAMVKRLNELPKKG